jgi:hypothetical protein
MYSHRAEAVIHTNINNNISAIMTVHFFHKLSPVLQKLQNILHLVDYGTHRLKYGVRSPKFIWAPCHVMCTAVLIAETPHPPPLSPHIWTLAELFSVFYRFYIFILNFILVYN